MIILFSRTKSIYFWFVEGRKLCPEFIWRFPAKTLIRQREDSDQPRHPLSLIRVFAVRMKKAGILSYLLSAQRRLWSDWAHIHFVGFIMWQLLWRLQPAEVSEIKGVLCAPILWTETAFTVRSLFLNKVLRIATVNKSNIKRQMSRLMGLWYFSSSVN